MKHSARAPSLLLALASFSGAASAVDSTVASGGFTGLGVTPTASLLGWGQFGFAYDRQLPGALNPSGNNFVGAFGLLPNLEVAGRIAANSLNANCFLEKCGIRDLSASAKFGIGLDAANRFRIAAGATDIGGAATNFRSYYGVLTYNDERVELSAGLAKRRQSGGIAARSPLDGPFASAVWQPLRWIAGHIEYTDRNAWAGVRVFAPAEWLPEGWSAHLGVNTRLSNSTVTDRAWVSAGVTIPLYKVPTRPGPRAPLAPLAGSQQAMPTYEARVPAPPVQPQPAPATPVVVTAATLEELAQALRSAGLEDISVGRMPDGSIAVRANNATYNWNSVDALGALLGATARVMGDSHVTYRAVLTQRQMPIVAVSGRADCLRQWIANPTASCAAGELSTPGTLALDASHAGADWVVRNLQPSWKTTRVQLTPVLRTRVATELGVLDYSAGLNVGILQPLWSGASAEWRIQHELARSSDYDPGAPFGRLGVLPGTERAVLTQTVPLPLARWFGRGGEAAAGPWGGAAAQVTAGRVGHHFDGVHGALRWEPGEGRHRFTAQGAWFRNSKFGLVPGEVRTAKPLLLSYRYNVAPTRTYLEATGGQFMNNDRGLQLGLRQWFGDVAVQLYLRRTRFSQGSRNVAGVEFSVPIGPRRDMQPAGIQVTGTPRFSHAVETVVGSGTNPVLFGSGVVPPVPSLESVYNSDRASLLYFEDNLPRLRDAAR